MNTTEKLFSEFAPVSREQWKTKAIEDLKGADFDKRLVWKTDEGFPIQPFYTEEDLQANPLLRNQYKLFSAPKRQWTNYVEIDATNAAEANARALEMKNFGANGFLFQLKEGTQPKFPVLLKGLQPETDEIAFKTPHPDPSLVSSYFDYLKEKQIKLANIKGFYSADVLETWITTGTAPDFKALAEVLKSTAIAPNFKGLAIKSHAFLNAGSNATQELAFLLSKLTDYIDKLGESGLRTSEIIAELMLHTAIGGDYFTEAAKLRALRILLGSVLKLYDGDASAVRILSSNATWSKSAFDPNVNMLRNTTEAMSALIGGCDALLIYPHDSSFKEVTPFSQRIALNIANILKEESYFDKVADPAAGSYYLENLTQLLAQRALELFKEVEEKGGFVKTFESNIIQEKIKAVRDKKSSEIATRKRVYVGTNKYPNLQEKTPVKVGNGKAASKEYSLLAPQRATEIFEKLRNRTLLHAEKTGFTPSVYLATFGNLAMRKARAGFSSEFFGTAGFEILGEFFHDDAVKAAEESAGSKADIVVICSSDPDYEAQGAAFAEKFRSIAKDKILVLAGYPEALVESLKKAGVDEFIHIKSNAVEVLSNMQERLLS